ncbi:sulfite exporter TauE/SafE [Pseudogulbenkiania sp. NH8B]|uniref:sulfite exporter TauE/SafE family protein n=1 Tax=Pseudogulbenkiania sp. (strain NH8B) TaxID=748280 RepID=UPI0002279E56|nr:sulfite exporter TauE/SafE family protein [Pseudogulbenkiania sp. NH8B]BAK76626.1 sulfite exporter TauE/SafE [Pseudogulbenkiania sp. NH8B]
MTVALLIAVAPSLALGAVLGALGGLLGIGGGIIAIPVLVLCYGMDQQMAQGTALVMMVPNVLIGFWRYRQRNPFPLRTALTIGLASIASTYPAARLAVALDAHALKLAFAVFLLWLAGYFVWISRRQAGGEVPSAGWNERYLPAVGVVGGLFAGLFSVGAGIVAAPILVQGFGKRQAVAQGLALALVVPGALVALATYSRAQHVDWHLGAPLAVGGMATISWGVALAHRLPERRLKQLFALMLLGTAILMMQPHRGG